MSAVILAALVLMWAVILVPMLVRKHDAANEMASAHRFAGAMRVLSRRRPRTANPLPAGERRAEVISQALASAPQRPSSRPPLPARSSSRAASRRAARVAARRRGLLLIVVAVVATAVVAYLFGRWYLALQGAVDVIALAGLAQLRSGAKVDRMHLRLPLPVAPRAEARITDAPVSPRTAPMPRRAPMPRFAPVAAPAAAPAARPIAAPVRLPAALVEPRVGKQIVFDAVSETPVVDKPRVARGLAPKPVKRSRPGVPADFYEGPASPPRPERSYRPLLDPVDSDPVLLTGDLEALDNILDRASGE